MYFPVASDILGRVYIGVADLTFHPRVDLLNALLLTSEGLGSLSRMRFASSVGVSYIDRQHDIVTYSVLNVLVSAPVFLFAWLW